MIYYQDQEEYGLEFAGHDTIDADSIAHFLQYVEKTSTYLGTLSLDIL
jgi:hypothetical protein